MKKTTKVLLTVSLTSFALSLTGMLWGLFLPVGAVLFGLFMIFNVLAKETDLFDKEHCLRTMWAEQNASVVRVSQKVSNAPAFSPVASR